MRILYVYDGDWPKGATRVVKETRSLARADMSWTDHLVRNPRFADWTERRALPRFQSIFVVLAAIQNGGDAATCAPARN